LAITTTSGPGIALKGEAMGLAVITELPLVVINVQRGGPSTGLPTKTEQSDLMQAMYGRNGEAPMPILASSTPGDCFYVAYEACRIAVKYMTPVMLLTDGYLANGSEPWIVPDIKELPPIDVKFADKSNLVDGQFMPYLRNKDTLARPWAKPGTENLEHRIGGIEKEDVTGNVNYDPENHHFMVKTRALKVQNIANELPPTDVFGEKSGDLLILSWGGTQGACRSATEALVNDGKKVSHIHLRWINPLPNDLGELLIKFKHVLIPEINLGQLIKIIRAEYLIDAIGLNKVKGKPISSAEIQDNVKKILEK
jgi:2-oxoglutarate ferredoxin oxidoreductase subunit alpha